MDVQLRLSVLAEVQRTLKNIEYKWYDIGVQLELDPDKLECIQHSYDTMGKRLIAMIQLWLKGLHPLPTWRKLCLVMEGVVVQEPAIAELIRREKGREWHEAGLK